MSPAFSSLGVLGICWQICSDSNTARLEHGIFSGYRDIIYTNTYTCTHTALHINETRSKPTLSLTVYSCVCDSIRLGTGLAFLISVADLGWLLQPITAPALRLSFGLAQHDHCVKTARLSFIRVLSGGP